MQKIHRFEHLTCTEGATVKEALSRIGKATPNLFQIVISDEGHVVGTITDGDVRRAMLDGITMVDAVVRCMCKTPIVGKINDDHGNRALSLRAWFVPVVDEQGKLDHVLVQARNDTRLDRALLMAGGFGRRLGELTRDMPKPLLPVGGRPILDRVLEQIENAGISHVTIAVHYKASQIKEFVRSRRNAVDISFIEEGEPRGTAGALSQLVGNVDKPLLVVNGDILTQVDLGAMHEFNLRHGYDGTVAVSRYEVEVPYGVIRQAGDGSFAGIDEKPRITYFVAAGMYFLSPEFVALTPSDRAVDMPELLTLGREAGLRIGLFPIHEYWKDVGQPDDLALAHEDHQSRG
jgi:dTDP-glucose pyrophosphorylase